MSTKKLMNCNDTYVLNNGVEIPCVAFGTYKAAENQSAAIIGMAIDAGYRHFDTAAFYGTEEYLAQAVKASGVPREEFFITSKVWKEDMGYEKTKAAFAKTLKCLNTDYLDLYLIHWPAPWSDEAAQTDNNLNQETWRAMEDLYKEGKIKAIGLSNFLPHHIENILKTATVKPMVNQLEFHPGYPQLAAVNYCQKNGILMEAWSPIGRARVLKDDLIVELAEKYKVSPAQICLRYAVQHEIIPLPKSSSLGRMAENQDLFQFEISRDDMYRLDTMPQIGWSGEHPDRERVYF